MAKALAKGDSANVSDVQQAARSFISDRTIARNMDAAIGRGLLTLHKRKSGEKVFVVASHEKAALLLGLLNLAR